MRTAVIMSTYNSIEWLEKVIWGFSVQTITDFELIIADDGSTSETKHKIEALRTELKLNIIHVWHEDHGFQKTKILNKAILASTADYLIFTDGDCIPRADFVETHLRYRQAGYFLSGGYFKLPMATSLAISKIDVLQQHCFQLAWLKANGLSYTSKSIKLLAKGVVANLLNALTPTTPSWNGHNASGWKADLLAVNGFDEEMKYGGEDRELGERLFHYGLSSKQIRYSAICVHLDHARGYVSEEVWKKNNAIRAYTKANKVVETPNGIRSN